MAPTRRTLGIAYLIGTGLALIVIQAIRLGAAGQVSPKAVAISFTGILAAGALVYAGYWLTTGSVTEARIWQIAKWGSFGLGLFVAIDAGILLLELRTGTDIDVGNALLIHNVTIGGVLGVLIGSAIEFKHAHDRSQRLNEQNAVLNRALRHNIRNEMNVMLGLVDNLENTVADADPEDLRLLRETGESILHLAEQARHADRAHHTQDLKALDLVQLLDRRVDRFRQQYPPASIEITGLAEARIKANDLLEIAIDNLLQNALDHHDGAVPLEIRIHIDQSDDGSTYVARILDNGPGIPKREIHALANGPEEPLRHSSGMGLWLSNWILESFGGELTVGNVGDRGTEAIFRLPATSTASNDRRGADLTVES